MRRQDFADGAGISGAVGRAADAGVHGAVVHARAAADTLQGAAHLFFAIGLAAAVVQQHEVHFLRAVQLIGTARAGNHVEIGGDVLADGAARQQAVQRRDVGQFGDHFFNAGNGDVHGRHGGGQAAVALVFHQAQRAGFGHGKVHAAQADIGGAVHVAQGLAGKAGELVHVVGQRCADVVVEQFAHLLFGFVDGRHHDVGRFFAGHLHDVFAQIAFHGFNAAIGQIMVQLDFLAHHRFAFHHQFALMVHDDAVDDAAGLVGRFRPMHFHAQTGQVAFQLLQQIGQFGQRTLADVLAQGAQHLQFLFVRQHDFALGHQHVHGRAQAFAQRFVGQGFARVGFEGFRARMEVYGLFGSHAAFSKSAGSIFSGRMANTTISRGPCAP